MHVYLLHIIDIICIDSTRFQPRSLPSTTKFDFNSVSVSVSISVSVWVSVALGLCFMIEHLDIPLLSGQPPGPDYQTLQKIVNFLKNYMHTTTYFKID